tara:strand:- start:7579 stop:8088 length:510 start_codon:yes stop_codon:yes gene_type:complete
MLGCPIEDAYSVNDATIIGLDKKKKKKKDKRDIIYDNELRPVNDSSNGGSYFSKEENDFSKVKQRLQSLSPYDNKYSPYEEITSNFREPTQLVQRPPEENKERNDMIQISNREYQLFKEYQQNKYSKNKLVEGFDSINDNFNDIILFALTGIFFLIFTDYIYKMGKKSY